MDEFEVIVIGLGAMGTATCLELARRGVRVLGIEQFDIPHGLGSSHGFSRMTRLAYYEHPDYVPLLKTSMRLWHDLESQGGKKLIYLTGGLYMGPGDGELIAGSLGSARRHGLDHEVLDADELRRRFPQFRVPENFLGLLESGAGFILPELAVATQAQLALQHGATFHGREQVLEWFADPAGVRVITSERSYHAAKLILCAGAWSGVILHELGVRLRVTRQVMAWVWPKKPELFTLGRLPVWAIDDQNGSIHYGFPSMLESPGLKLAHHAPGPIIDPDHLPRRATPSDEQSVRPVLRQCIPDADGPILSLRVCLYTSSPDHHFLVDRHPIHEHVIFAAGFSGHGFKFAPVMGQALADLATEGKSDHPIGFLGLSRLSPQGR